MTKKFKIFLISGKAESGKNTVADLIKEYYLKQNEKSVVTSYAKYIKQLAIELTDWDGIDENKPRTLLQDIGSMIRNDIHNEEYFVNRIIDDIKVYREFVDNVIIADVRLPLEITKIKENYSDVYTLKINKENKNNQLNKMQQNHITEIALDNFKDFDYIIDNNSSLDNLKIVVYSILDKIN